MNEIDQLCQICAEVDLYHSFTGPRYFPQHPNQETIPFQALGTLKDIKSNARCPLCRLFKHILYRHADSIRQVLRGLCAGVIDDNKVQCALYPMRQDYHEDMKYESSRTRDLVATGVGVFVRGTQDCSPEEARFISSAHILGGLQLLSPSSVDPARPLANGFRVTTMQRNLELISQWLQTCRDTHKDTCQGAVFPTACSPAGFSRIRLINIQSRTISVHNIAEVEYAALSYVWGENAEARVKLASDLAPSPGSSAATAVSLPSETPKVVEDALRICAALSIAYLWVDLYCIDQQDAQQKAAEINAMGYIYNHAHLTLVDGRSRKSTDANAGLLPEDTTSDLGGNQRIETIGDKCYITTLPQTIDRIHASQWERRGWTYQEGALSRRIALFSQFDVSFMCGAGLWCERLHSGEYGHDADLPHLDLRSSGCRVLSSNDWLQKADWDFSDYDGILTLYTGRDLSFESDKVAAISGCFNILAQNMDLHFVWGLPTKDFHYALLWDSQADQEREGFPSWSWAGSRSRQSFHHFYPNQKTSGSLVLDKMDDVYEYHASSMEVELAGLLIHGIEDAHQPNRCRQRPAPLQLSTKFSTVRLTSEAAHFSVDIIALDANSDSNINTEFPEAMSWDAEKTYFVDLALRNSAGSQYRESRLGEYRPWPPFRIGLSHYLRGSTITWLLRDGIDLVNILDIEMLEGDAGGDALPSRRVFCLGIVKSRGGNRRMGTVHMTREMWEAACPTITTIELS
ncbi:heterokaryon incompatibility protein-domain-containing protein [Pestalotiopsis sp. NC0098]|nr:heterokaryon incompatibility protein-domain-containing protein [Pestalotiopsis sp. NC0098]